MNLHIRPSASRHTNVLHFAFEVQNRLRLLLDDVAQVADVAESFIVPNLGAAHGCIGAIHVGDFHYAIPRFCGCGGPPFPPGICGCGVRDSKSIRTASSPVFLVRLSACASFCTDCARRYRISDARSSGVFCGPRCPGIGKPCARISCSLFVFCSMLCLIASIHLRGNGSALSMSGVNIFMRSIVCPSGPSRYSMYIIFTSGLVSASSSCTRYSNVNGSRTNCMTCWS